MKAHAMATAASMASAMRSSISPHEGPRGVACESAESSGGLGRAPEVESVGKCIHFSVRRRTKVGSP
jgi:hypothetical protein